MPRKRKLAERASDYVSRTMPCLTGLESWITAWAERAWIAGYRAGKSEGGQLRKQRERNGESC